MNALTLFSHALALALILPVSAYAQEAARAFSPDRPSFTGSPYTLDQGRFQFEMGLGSFTRDTIEDGGVATEVKTFGTAAPTLRWGVTEDIELQVGFGGLVIEETRTPLAKDRSTSVGDISLSSKVNFWGNDSGSSAFGMIPYISAPVSTPSAGSRKVTGGVNFPLAIALPGDIAFGLQAGIEMNPNDSGNGYGAVINNSAIAGINLTPEIGGYIEIFNVKDTRAGNTWENAAGLGLSYRLTDNLQFDTCVNVGLSDAANDLELLFGFAIRL